jgi:hypothetical protein
MHSKWKAAFFVFPLFSHQRRKSDDLSCILYAAPFFEHPGISTQSTICIGIDNNIGPTIEASFLFGTRPYLA